MRIHTNANIYVSVSRDGREVTYSAWDRGERSTIGRIWYGDSADEPMDSEFTTNERDEFVCGHHVVPQAAIERGYRAMLAVRARIGGAR